MSWKGQIALRDGKVMIVDCALNKVYSLIDLCTSLLG